MDFCGKWSELGDFEYTVDRGSALIFGSDSGLCLSYVRILGPKRNLDHRSFFSLSRYVNGLNEFIQIISCFSKFLFSKEVHLNSVVILLLELYCAVVIKHVAFFTICVKLIVTFTCTS